MASYHDGLISDDPASDLEVVPEQQSTIYADKQQQEHMLYSQPIIAPAQNHRTICGIRRITFLLLVIIVVLIIVGAVGGGVGGSLAVKNAQNSALNSVFVTPLTSIHKISEEYTANVAL